MTNFIRWAIPGFALGVLLSLSPSCGPNKPRCTAANCAGCCDATGTCNPGNNGNACGISGELCRACGFNETCTLGRCTAFGQGGGGGAGGGFGGGSGGGGGTSDGGLTCAQFASQCGSGTCCKMVGGAPSCVSAGSSLDCRNSGGICEICTGSQTCQTSGCISSTCQGCQGTTGCIATSAQNNTACGINGAACTACPNGASCTNGICVGGTGGGAGGGVGGGAGGGVGGGAGGGGGGGGGCGACSAGCCNGTTCVPWAQQNNFTCGTGGLACNTCPTNTVCGTTGSCVSGTGGGSGGGAGGGAGGGGGGFTCTGCQSYECCDTSNGQCVGAYQAQCGANGSNCAACNNSTQTCSYNSSTCVPAGSGALGAACTGDTNCALGYNTQNSLCITGFTGGYCSDVCNGTYTCKTASGADDPNAICSTGSTSSFGYCLSLCSTVGTTCNGRSNYVCEDGPFQFQGGGLGICIDKCTANSDCSLDGGMSCTTSTGRCCGRSGYPCCTTGTACNGPALDGGTSTCFNGYCR